jgi:hypothetical protein
LGGLEPGLYVAVAAEKIEEQWLVTCDPENSPIAKKAVEAREAKRKLEIKRATT